LWDPIPLVTQGWVINISFNSCSLGNEWVIPHKSILRYENKDKFKSPTDKNKTTIDQMDAGYKSKLLALAVAVSPNQSVNRQPAMNRILASLFVN
jgi:hypothetical protein